MVIIFYVLSFLFINIFSANPLLAKVPDEKKENLNSENIIGITPTDLLEDSVLSVLYGKKINEIFAIMVPISIKSKLITEESFTTKISDIRFIGLSAGLGARFQLKGSLFDEGLFFEIRNKIAILKSSDKYRAKILSGTMEFIFGYSMELISGMHIEASILAGIVPYKRTFHSQRVETGLNTITNFQISIFSPF